MTRSTHALAGVALPLALTLAPAASAQNTAGSQRSAAPSETGETRNPATPTITSYPSAAVGDGPTANGYNLSRWVEDWRGMRDPAKRDDPLDRLKFLPLDDDGDVYLTLSGEARLRVNMTSNPGLRETPHQRQDITRLVGGADLHVGPHFRFFGEVAHAGLAGRGLGTPAATLRNDLVFQQYFAEANADVSGVAIGARYGRQEFTDGANLLVSQRDNNTIRFTLNGVRAWARSSSVRGDVFDYRFTRLGTGGTQDDDMTTTAASRG